MESFRPYSLQYLIDGISGPVELIAPELQGGYFPKDNTGMALWNPGKSAAVFPFLINKQRKAVKIWYNHENKGKKERYEAIKGLYNNISIPYFSNARYIPNALNINNTPHDVLVMDWVGRQNIKEYIIANIHEVQKMHALAVKILELHKEMNEHGIAHGHLNCSNIYIDANNELQLIDYDTVFIKGVTPSEKVVNNYPDYTHPSERRATNLNDKADYFSALILYIGVKTIAENNSLWGRYAIGNRDGFVFTQEDFSDLTKSTAYADIKKMGDPLLDKLLNILQLFCAAPDTQALQPFYEYLLKNTPLTVTPGTTSLPQEEKQSPEQINPLKANDTGASKKVSVILPHSNNQQESNTTQPEKTEEPNNNPTLPSWITEAEPVVPVNKVPRKSYATEERVLSNIWIHKNDNTDAAIVKVFNSSTSAEEDTVKEIKRFSASTEPAIQEKIAEEVVFEKRKKSGISKKGILITLLTALVITGATAGIYLVNSKGIDFSSLTNTADATKETTITPIEKSGVLAIEPSKEEENINIAGPETAVDSLSANNTQAISNVSDSATFVATEAPATITAPVNPATKEVINTAQPKIETISSSASTATVANTATEKTESIKVQLPVAKEIAKKEKLKPAPKAENDILDDISPSKGFNTGIKTKNQ
jgi:hypothetical protein